MQILHIACFYGYLNIINLLIEAGTDVNKRDNCKRTPLRWATKKVYTDAIELLESYGAHE